ncbi:hypothetical protein FGG08_006993 [Glutinoglossum americanum]|uniref:Uncharacterized protein n=1 Tax=Glutinoglossum americanum TaxID=1670608 RepID=A0A9P8HX66_9PEZI|nr:hypothetical protein FGG08_006993 [Glutinoglossum americanum]
MSRLPQDLFVGHSALMDTNASIDKEYEIKTLGKRDTVHTNEQKYNPGNFCVSSRCRIVVVVGIVGEVEQETGEDTHDDKNDPYGQIEADVEARVKEISVADRERQVY